MPCEVELEDDMEIQVSSLNELRIHVVVNVCQCLSRSVQEKPGQSWTGVDSHLQLLVFLDGPRHVDDC